MASRTQDKQGIERLIMIAAAIMLLPMCGYSFYMAWDAWTEGERLADAPVLPEAGARVDRQLYRVMGMAEATWLSPPEMPDVTGALEFKVRKERRQADGTWKEVPHDYPQVSRIDGVKIAGVPVKIDKYSTVVMPEAVSHRKLGDGERLVIGQHVGAGQELVAYGHYSAGYGGLIGGTLQRLMVVSPVKEPEVIKLLEKSGKIKAGILAGVGALILVLMAYVLRRAVR